ncbi:MAG: hypothetical protein QOF92_4239 [Pseudonocardiales bacterium]|nr:hypothetical protein [Pseudonocardiales bacterium]
MRWPFRRGDQGAGAHVEADAQPAPPAAAPAAAPEPGWTSLPPIASTWAAKTPLTAAPHQIRAPLTQEPARRTPVATPAEGAPEPGRVIGLAAVIAPQPAEPERPSPARPAYFREQPPLRHVTARPLTEHPPLMEATDDFVGPPVAPVSAPAPVRATPTTFFPQRDGPRPDPAAEASTDAGARFREALANLGRSGLPEYIPRDEATSATEWRRPETPTPAPVPQGVQPRPAVSTPLPGSNQRMTHRRNSLAESRRLGLGAPLRRDTPSDDGDGTPPSDAEPAPAPALVHPAPPPPPVAAPLAIEAPVEVSPPAAPPPPAPEPPAARTETPPEPVARHAAPDDDDSAPAPTRSALQPIVVAAHPVTDGTARPLASTAPLVFRARGPRPDPSKDATLPAPMLRAVERAVVTRAPAELAQAIRSSHGVDVSEVPVQRDTDAASEARQRRARAFTRGGRVFLPETAGALNSPEARGLLAHELVHAAQQLRFGGALPDESTPEGRALEAEAVAAERMYSAAPTAPFEEPVLVHAPQAVTAGWVETLVTQRAGDAVDYLNEQTTLDDSQRANFDAAAEEAAKRVWDDYRERGGSGSSDTPFTTPAEEQIAERQFLDVINTELDARGEARQSGLSDDDRERVRQMLSGSAGGSGGGQLAPPPSTAANRWQQNTFGSATALGGDFAGLMAWTPWGRPDGHGGAGGAAEPPSRASQFLGHLTGDGPAPQAGGQAGQTQQGLGGAGTAEHQTGLSRFAANLFGADAALGADVGGLSALFHGRGFDPGGAGQPGTGTGPDGAGGQSAHSSDAHRRYLASRGGIDPVTNLARENEPGSDQAGGHAADPDIDLDELALRLYARLRSRLRRELLVDRERAGLLTDYR